MCGGLDSKGDFGPWMWGVFFGGILHSPVDGSAESCNFGFLPGEEECLSFYSAILFSSLSLFFCRQILFFFFASKIMYVI